MSDENGNEMDELVKNPNIFIGIGVAMGVSMGVVFGNITAGLVIGIIAGVVFSLFVKNNNKDE